MFGRKKHEREESVVREVQQTLRESERDLERARLKLREAQRRLVVVDAQVRVMGRRP